MRILQVVQDFPPHNCAGVEIYTYNLSKELLKKHEVFIFYRVNDVKNLEYEVRSKNYKGLNIFTINNTFKDCYSFEGLYKNDVIAWKFGKVLDDISPDVVHIQHLIFLSVTLIEEIKKRNIPIVFTLHDYWLICPQWHFLDYDWNICKGDETSKCITCLGYQMKIKKTSKKTYNLFRSVIPKVLIPVIQKIYFQLTKWNFDFSEALRQIELRKETIKDMLKKIDIFVAPSKFIKKRFIKFGIPEDKIIFSQYGINAELFKNVQTKNSNTIKFGFIGTVLPAKGLHVLIKAFNKINSGKANLKIYGKLYPYRGFEYYPRFVKKLVKNKNIRFMGNFDNSELEKVFSNIDVLIVPSIWYENSPLTIQESFLFKTPVIASNIGGIPELIKDKENGLLFEPRNVNDLYQKMKLIIENPRLLRELSKNLPFPNSIKENAKQLEKLYISLGRENVEVK